MKILERNYQSSLQSYLSHENSDEAKELIRRNLLSRLSCLVKRDLDQEEINTSILPNLTLRIVKLNNENSKPLFIGGLTVKGVKFPGESEPLNQELHDTFKNSGVDLPSPEFLDNKLDKMYSNNVCSNTFNLKNVHFSELPLKAITEKEFSDLSILEDTFYSSYDNHFKLLKSVSLLAMHKHVSENPSSDRARLVKGIDNLSKDIDDDSDKAELRKYLIEYIDKPNLRPLLVKESELFIKSRSDKSNLNIPLWVIMSIVSALLIGAIVYTQRDTLKTAWNFSKEVKTSNPEFSVKKSFFKALFSPSGRTIAKSYLNNKNIEKVNSNWLKELPLLKKEAEVKVERSQFDMTSLMNKFVKNDR